MKGWLMTPWKAQAIHESNPEIEWQTRRLIKPQLVPFIEQSLLVNGKVVLDMLDFEIPCPFSIGEQVYIKETHYLYGHWFKTGGVTDTGRVEWAFEAVTPAVRFPDDMPYKVQKGRKYVGWYKRPSLFLPADLARTVVTIKDIRAQRVQDISEKDARAEGCKETRVRIGNGIHWESARGNFCLLWDSIHGEGAWERNDWVCAYSFIRREHDNR